MFRFVLKQGRSLFLLLAVLAIVLSACSSSAITAAPAGTGNNGGSTPAANNGGSPAATSGSTTSGGSGLSGAASAFSSITSYKFSMTLAGGDFASTLSMLGGSSASGNAPFTMSGTVTLTPDKAADINMAGFHIIEVGGYDYLDLGGSGSFLKTAVSGTGMADSLSPAAMFSNAIDPSVISGYNKVGSETKNGVACDHYQASAAALADYGSLLDVAGATWTADVWIAQDGGYPVSMDMLATASDNSVAYEMKFDITNVNDPANKVTAPTNVTGE
jgi:hypothetical protein